VSGLDAVDHIVVVMLENRSFDQMLGFLYPKSNQFEGLDGTEENLWHDPANPAAPARPVPVFKVTADMENADWYPLYNPKEGFPATTFQLFAAKAAPSPATATMAGFLDSFSDGIAHPEFPGDPYLPPVRNTAVPGASIMGMFDPSMVPVLAGLARGFAVCDLWFASVPTQTLPNRACALAGTSLGRLANRVGTQHLPFDTPSVFGRLTAAGHSWKIYSPEAKPLTAQNFPDTSARGMRVHFGDLAAFKTDAAAGHLPDFSFIEPVFGSYGKGASPSGNWVAENDQHPVSSVANGDQFLYGIYEAVRTGTDWSTTLLLITYDEHGGNYDHVPPPADATPPDDHVQEGFDFKRFGVRVPAVLVSPLIPAGTILRAPDGGPPFDHTSIIATVRKRFGIGPLGARDAIAPDVGSALSLSTARTDDPLKDVTPRTYSPPTGVAAAAVTRHPSSLVKAFSGLVANLHVPDAPAPDLANLHTAAEHMAFIHDRLDRYYAQPSAGN
jgi:phospholipase C